MATLDLQGNKRVFKVCARNVLFSGPNGGNINGEDGGRSKMGFFSNWKGGAGQNIEDDTVQEICNKISKSIVKQMGANKTMNAISQIAQAIGGIKEICENYDHLAGIAPESSHHTRRSAEEDELQMINDIADLKPFDHFDGRAHASFPDIKRSPLQYLDIVSFHKWLDDLKRKF